MKRLQTALLILAAVASMALIIWTVADAAPSTSPPEIPTMTAPAPDIDSYPPPVVAPYPAPYPAAYPAFVPFLADGNGESYP